jgi:hypothetical protein
MSRAKMSLARIELLAHLIDSLRDDQAQERADVEGLITKEVAHLAELMSGRDAFSGMLDAMIRPALQDLNIEL